MLQRAQWRPVVGLERDWEDTLGRLGGPNKAIDFQEVEEWTRIGEVGG